MSKIRKSHQGKSRKADSWMSRIVSLTVILIALIIAAFKYLPSIIGTSTTAPNDYIENIDYALDGSDKTYINFLPEGGSQAIIHHKHYSLAYNESKEQADWVMYELTKASLQAPNVPRAKRFNDDPLVRTTSAYHNDYTNSGFTRGHLAPAGDMAFSSDAMRESFYMSNMSPQPRPFNNGIWKELEETVRDWAYKKGSVYIVTGPVFESNNNQTIGRNKVAVPDAFYKLIVDANTKQNVAYLIPNELSNKHLDSYALSVDDLESKLNLELMSGFLTESQESEVETKYWPIDDRKFQSRVNHWNKE